MNWWVYHKVFHKPLPPARYKRQPFWDGGKLSATLTAEESAARRIADDAFMGCVRAAAAFQLADRPTFEGF